MKSKRPAAAARAPLAPLYLFHGQEDFLIEQSVQQIVARSLDEAARGFNYDVVDGSKTDGPSVVALASAYPMMSERRVVVVREFEKLTKKESDREALDRYCRNPLESTVLIMIALDVDLRRKPFSTLKSAAEIYECKPLYDDKVPAWIEAHIRSKGKSADPGAVMLFHEYVGNSLRSLDSEIAKVMLYVGDRPTLTEDDVLAAVGASRVFSVFDLQSAIGTRKARQCYNVVRVMLQGGQRPEVILGSLVRFFTQLWKLTDPEIARLDDARLASEIGTHPFYVRQYKQYRKTFTLDEIEKAFRILHELDITLKTKQRDEAISFELALHEILRRKSDVAVRGLDVPVAR